MKLLSILNLNVLGFTCAASVFERTPLSYAPKPDGIYTIPKKANVTTLLDFVNSRSDLTELARILNASSGFAEAFDTTPTWDFTFFAPSNEAFTKHTGQYFNTFEPTPKGRWWLGNLVQHHYVPNTQLKASLFNETATRLQTGSYLYVGTQVKNGQLWLNDVAMVTEKELSVTKVCCRYSTLNLELD
ncbi:hypothetical protein C8035_v009527 [Colletotrichum spinosum]|uniref:FAS1 domain-containing protein n=1 Tax=Colletotrichum spinosum TaxID=1347390 RepID=A0A4R8Q6Q7_9PEZI|nr:hypothetical protein C8035_v009527 [Colletotrichum spinosum]